MWFYESPSIEHILGMVSKFLHLLQQVTFKTEDAIAGVYNSILLVPGNCGIHDLYCLNLRQNVQIH